MNTHCSFHIEMRNEPSVLGRLLLAFARRRLRISTMSFDDAQSGYALLRIALECRSDVAGDVAKQLRRVVEVTEVALSMAEPAAEAATLDRSAA